MPKLRTNTGVQQTAAQDRAAQDGFSLEIREPAHHLSVVRRSFSALPKK